MPGTTHRRPPSALVYYTLIVSLAHGSAGPRSLRSHRPRAAALVIRSRPAAALAVLAPCARSVAADAAAQHQHLLFPPTHRPPWQAFSYRFGLGLPCTHTSPAHSPHTSHYEPRRPVSALVPTALRPFGARQPSAPPLVEAPHLGLAHWFRHRDLSLAFRQPRSQLAFRQAPCFVTRSLCSCRHLPLPRKLGGVAGSLVSVLLVLLDLSPSACLRPPVSRSTTSPIVSPSSYLTSLLVLPPRHPPSPPLGGPGRGTRSLSLALEGTL